MDDINIVKVFTGSVVTVNLLKDELESIGINSLIKNDFRSGVNSGFYGGDPAAIDLYIDSDELEKAGPVIEAFKKVNE